MRSIMQRKDGTCYLCKLLEYEDRIQPTQEHHVIFGHGSRRLSERYGLKVYLCIRHHLHDGGPDAVHRNPEIRKMLCRKGQEAFNRAYPNLDFVEIFGKNWLEDEPSRQQDSKEGFSFLEEGQGLTYEEI